MADINFNDLTNGNLTPQNEWEGTGVFDKLIMSINSNIDSQFKKGRITGADYANVYLGSIQTAIAQSMQFVLTEQLQEAQIADIDKSIEIKERTTLIQEADLVDRLKTSEKQRTLLDEEIETANLQQIQVDKQTKEIIDSTTRANIQLNDQLETSEKQRILLDTDEQIKQYEHDILQQDTHNTNTKQLEVLERTTVIQETDLNDKLQTSEKQRILLDEEKESADLQQVLLGKDVILKEEQIETENKNQLLLDTEEAIKNYENEVLQVDNHITSTKQQLQLDVQTKEIVDSTVRSNIQLNDQLVTSEKQRILLDTQEEYEQFKVDSIQPVELSSMEKDIDVKERTTLVQETDLNDKLVTTAKQRVLIDEEIETANLQQVQIDKQTLEIIDGTIRSNVQLNDQLLTSDKQRILLDTEEEIKQYEHDVLQVDQHATNTKQQLQINAQTDEIVDGTTRANIQLNDQLETSIKQRILLDEEKETADLNQIQIDKKTKEIVDSTVRSNIDLNDKLITSEKQRILLDTQEEYEQFKVDSMQPVELESLIKDIDVKERTTQVQETDLLDKISTSEKQRILLDEEKETADKQQILLDIEERAKQYEVDVLQVDTHVTNIKQQTQLDAQTKETLDSTIRSNIDLTDKISTSEKQRILLDTQEEFEQFKVDSMQPVELESLVKDIDIKERSTQIQESDLIDKLKTSEKQRILLDEEKETADKQQILLDTQEEYEQFKVDYIQPVELDSLIKDIDIKERTTVVQEAELEDKLQTSVKQRILLDEEVETANLNQVLLSTQEEYEQFKVDSMQPKELESLEKDIDVKERSTVVQEAELNDKLETSIKQRILLDEEVETANLQQIQIDKQTKEIIDSTTRSNIQLDDQLLTSEKQRVLLDTQEEAEQFKVDSLLPTELSSMKKDIEVKERSTQIQEVQLGDKLQTSIKERILLDEQKESADLEQEKIIAETKIIEQKIVGKKQSTVIGE